mgnify:FL=1
MTKNEVCLHIKVTNTETKVVYDHRRIPLEHVETLKMSPNLKVEIVGPSRGLDNDKYYKARSRT